MGATGLWQYLVGKREQCKRVNLGQCVQGLGRVAIDVSGWVHVCDNKEEAQLTRTSSPIYPSTEVLSQFQQRHTILINSGLKPTYYFDGHPHNMKKAEIDDRRQLSEEARAKYAEYIKQVKRECDEDSSYEVDDKLFEEIMKQRKASARRTPNDDALIANWCIDNGVPIVRASFKADAQMYLAERRGEVDMVMTEDGDLVILGAQCIITEMKFDYDDPKNSSCRMYKASDHSSFYLKCGPCLAEFSCIIGNDCISRVPGKGPTTVMKQRKKESSSLMEEIISAEKTEDLIFSFESANKAKLKLSSGWGRKFLQASRLIRHFPIFEQSETSGDVLLVPLNPLPDGISLQHWGSYIGFEKNPSEYFSETDCIQYYHLNVMAYNLVPREALLGYRDGTTKKIFDPFQFLHFDLVPFVAEHQYVLRCWLIHHGVIPEYRPTRKRLVQLVRECERVHKLLLPLSLRLQPILRCSDIIAFQIRKANDCFDTWNHDSCLSKIRNTD